MGVSWSLTPLWGPLFVGPLERRGGGSTPRPGDDPCPDDVVRPGRRRSTVAGPYDPPDGAAVRTKPPGDPLRYLAAPPRQTRRR